MQPAWPWIAPRARPLPCTCTVGSRSRQAHATQFTVINRSQPATPTPRGRKDRPPARSHAQCIHGSPPIQSAAHVAAGAAQQADQVGRQRAAELDRAAPNIELPSHRAAGGAQACALESSASAQQLAAPAHRAPSARPGGHRDARAPESLINSALATPACIAGSEAGSAVEDAECAAEGLSFHSSTPRASLQSSQVGSLGPGSACADRHVGSADGAQPRVPTDDDGAAQSALEPSLQQQGQRGRDASASRSVDLEQRDAEAEVSGTSMAESAASESGHAHKSEARLESHSNADRGSSGGGSGPDADMERSRSDVHSAGSSQSAFVRMTLDDNAHAPTSGSDSGSWEQGETLSTPEHSEDVWPEQADAPAEVISDGGGTAQWHENDHVENGMRVLGRVYHVEAMVGEGAYGKVMRCRIAGRPGEEVAVKEFKISESDADAEDVKRTAHREAALMKRLSHAHVVQCLDSFLVRDRLFIVMEFLPMTLLDLVEATNGGGGLDHATIRRVVYQLVKVMRFIHSQVRAPVCCL